MLGKEKLLLIKDYLYRYSDEEHIVTTNELIEMLERNNISAERKSIYRDIDVLIDYGLDIIKSSTGKKGYYLASRDFELVELRLLLDAVQSADFITANKTKRLVEKICTLCSSYEAKSLKSQVYIDSRVKSSNEHIYYFIDTLSRAIDNKFQISCEYEKIHGISKLSNSRSEIKTHIISPYALLWSDDHYYIVGNNQKYDNLMHLRIDRIKSIEILEDKPARPFSEVCGYKNNFDIADYTEKLFNMFSGEIKDIKLKCKIELLEQMFDRFGSSCSIRENFEDNTTFFLSAKGAISEGLASWLMQYSDGIMVLEPARLKEMIIEKANSVSKLYSSC